MLQRVKNRSINLSFLDTVYLRIPTFSDVLKVITPSRPELVSAIFHKTPSRRCSVHQSCTSQMPSRAYTFYHSTPQRAENLSINVECLRHSPQHWKRLPSKRPKARFSENTCLRQLHTFIYYIHTSTVQYQTSSALARLGPTKALLYITCTHIHPYCTVPVLVY